MEENRKLDEVKEENAENKPAHSEHHFSHEYSEEHKAHHINHSSEDRITGRKEKIKAWLKDPYNLAFLGIFILAIALRFYYFWLTKNQPLWWDEAEYMSAAKGYAGIIDYSLQIQRLPGFPLLASLFFLAGINNEFVLRFFLCFLPSLIAILLFYLVLSQMYSDRKIILIATLIFGVLWQSIFYSNRFQTENFALIFQLLGIIVLFKSYIKKEKIWFINPRYSLIAVFLLMCMGVIFRPASGMAIPPVIIFVFWINRKKILSKKFLPFFAGILFALAVLSYFGIKILEKMHYYQPENAIAFFHPWNVFYDFYFVQGNIFLSVFFYAFWLGIILSIISFLFVYDRVFSIKEDSDNPEVQSDLFNILMIVGVVLLFVFIVRSPAGDYEPRWFLSIATGLVVFPAKAIVSVSSKAGKILKMKNLTILLIILLVGIGVYSQIYLTDTITRMKVDSYLPVKESGLWLKENSNKNDLIWSLSMTQHMYYSERNVTDYLRGKNNLTSFDEFVKTNKPRFIVQSIFEPVDTPWLSEWLQQHNSTAVPVKVYTMSTNQGVQPVLIIYEIKYPL